MHTYHLKFNTVLEYNFKPVMEIDFKYRINYKWINSLHLLESATVSSYKLLIECIKLGNLND